ncbi:MAG: hypothetical protein ACO4CG_15940, partial [Prochlorothrix sp.]
MRVAMLDDQLRNSVENCPRIDPSAYKQGVAQAFGSSAVVYHQFAQLQRHCAQQLLHQLQQRITAVSTVASTSAPSVASSVA